MENQLVKPTLDTYCAFLAPSNCPWSEQRIVRTGIIAAGIVIAAR
jgi:hypothetical protein